MNLPKDVRYILDKLEGSGFEAYVVGGCVRSGVLNQEINDWDICTSATPQEVIDVFESYPIIPSGLNHGTVIVRLNHESYEITTFRNDGEYKDNRRPEKVFFVKNIVEDLARRDFTMNAIAYNEEFIDPFNGFNDIENKVVRCVGNPDDRFTEDALRIIRALRFAAVLNFEIDDDTKKSIFKNKDKLLNISKERIQVELNKLVCGINVFNVLMEYKEVIGIIIPELIETFDFEQNNKYHIYNVYEHTCYAIKNSVNDLEVRLALLLHDIAKPSCYSEKDFVGHFYGHAAVGAEYSKKILRNLKYSNDMIKKITLLIKHHDDELICKKKIVNRFLARLDQDLIFKLLDIKRADILAQNPEFSDRLNNVDKFEALVNEVLDNFPCFKIKDLKVNGLDMIELGLKASDIGKMLKDLLNLVIEEKIINDKDILINYVKNKR